MPANRDEFFAKLAPLDAEQRVTFRRLATEAQSALHATDRALGATVLDARGAEFTAGAVPQLMRWERSTGGHTARA